MRRGTLHSRLTWILLALLSLLTSAQAQAVPPAAPRQQSAEPAGGLQPLSPDSPLYGPALDPRALRDRQQAEAQQRTAPRQLSADLISRLQGAPKTPGKIDQITPKNQTSGATPQGSSGCAQWILNPGLTDTNANSLLDPGDGPNANWYTDIVVATIDVVTYTSAPNAVRLQDGDETSGAPDSDMISQDMAFNSSDTDISIQFDLLQTASDPGYDYLYYGFATFSGPTLDTLLYWNVVPEQTPGTWQTIYDRIDDPTLMQQLKAADLVGSGVWLVFFNNTDGVAPFVGSVIDEVYATTCTSSGTVTGAVTEALAPADAPVLLSYSNSATGAFEIVGSTTASLGGYSFSGLRPLVGDGSDSYQAYFSNDGSDDSRVSLWVGPTTTALSGGTATLTSFDIADVALTSPADAIVSTLPATFSWASRGDPNEGYYYCIYDTATFIGGCTARLSNTSYQLTLADLGGIPGLNFQYGASYAWYVIVEGANGDATQGIDYGFSFYERSVSFTATAPPTPPPPPPPSGQPPTGTGTKDWTVMVYIAGDNNLGDLQRYPNPSANLQGQFATLKQLAASYPNINIVTLTDFFDGSGTSFCHLKPNATQACQQLGEKDTSDPAVLSDFIDQATTNFPASHTMLVIADHGHSIGGVAADETTSPTAVMDPAELRQAYQSSALATQKADIIFYNACLMGSLESAFNAAPYANYLVASADELWVLSIYERVLPLLASSSATVNDPRAVAAGMVDAYRRSVQSAGSLYISSAAYDLSRVTVVNNEVSQLGIAISDGLTSPYAELVRSTLNRIRGNAQVYDSSGNNLLDPAEDAFVDLRHLATLLSTMPDAGNGGTVAELTVIKARASALLTALGPVGGAGSLVIASQQLTGSNGEGGQHNLSNATGISIFMPNGDPAAFSRGQQRALSNLYLNGTTFTQLNTVTQWDDALRLYTGIGSDSAPTGGPGRFVRGTLPIDGALPSISISLPLVVR